MALVNPSFVRMVHSKDREIHVWTINDAKDMDRLLDMGVDGIITDRSDIAVTVVAKRRALL